MRNHWHKFLYALIVIFVFIGSYGLNVFFSFDPRHIDPVPEVTANTLLPPDKQVPFRHFPVSLKDIPPACQKATIAIEDHNFYFHVGIDLSGMIRGVVGQIAGIDVGGSTLDQQLVKNFSSQVYNRSFNQKIVESIQALRLDSAYSKSEILEMYLNSIYYGNYNYGIEAAAEQYFGKVVSQLNLAECAYLAGLPQQPSIFNPYANLEAGIARQKLVLKAMLREGYITRTQESEAENVELKFQTLR
jgi:penicillin-binding protein 1A